MEHQKKKKKKKKKEQLNIKISQLHVLYQPNT